MAGKREKPEDFFMKLRQVKVLQGQGMAISDAVREIGVTQHLWTALPLQVDVELICVARCKHLSGVIR